MGATSSQWDYVIQLWRVRLVGASKLLGSPGRARVASPLVPLDHLDRVNAVCLRSPLYRSARGPVDPLVLSPGLRVSFPLPSRPSLAVIASPAVVHDPYRRSLAPTAGPDRIPRGWSVKAYPLEGGDLCCKN